MTTETLDKATALKNKISIARNKLVKMKLNLGSKSIGINLLCDKDVISASDWIDGLPILESAIHILETEINTMKAEFDAL